MPGDPNLWQEGVAKGDSMVRLWAVPIVVALAGATVSGPVVGLLAGILTALVWPRISAWWLDRRYEQAIERQAKFLEEYDVCAVAPDDYGRFLLATYGETDPTKAFLMDRKTMRKARLAYPTKAKTDADKKAVWDKEEERRRSLGFPSQNVRRDFKSEWPLCKPHYQHLKAGIKVPTCWLCDQDTPEQDRIHLDVMGRLERDEAETKAKNDSVNALFCLGEIPPANTLRCEEAEQLYAKLKSKNAELRAAVAAYDWKAKSAISEGHSLILGRINAARACGKYGPCTIHVAKTFGGGRTLG